VKDLSKPPDEKNLILKLEDIERALDDVEPKFGAKNTELKALFRNGFVPYGESFDYIMNTMERLVDQGKNKILCVVEFEKVYLNE
jgi:vesicle-fusing ATPase